MQKLSRKKVAELEAKAPGITLSGWLDINYKHVTLTQSIGQDGKRLVVPQHNVELTVALLSCDNVADWARVALHYAPAGTVVDKIPERYYLDKVLLLRQLLTKELLVSPDNKLALRYLQILERRDADRWAQRKQAVALKASAETPQDGGENGSRKVIFDFEIVQ